MLIAANLVIFFLEGSSEAPLTQYIRWRGFPELLLRGLHPGPSRQLAQQGPPLEKLKAIPLYSGVQHLVRRVPNKVCQPCWACGRRSICRRKSGEPIAQLTTAAAGRSLQAHLRIGAPLVVCCLAAKGRRRRLSTF